MGNIGRKITSAFCNGFFFYSRDFDLCGAEIIEEDDEFIVIRRKDGLIDFCSFQDVEYDRDEEDRIIGLASVTCLNNEEKQKYIDKWCK